MPLPNLRALYGKRYKVVLDPCADSWKDPAYHVIPGRPVNPKADPDDPYVERWGAAYPHSEAFAAVEVNRRSRSALAVLRAAYAARQDGDDLTTFLVPWADLGEVLPLVRPHKRRQLSEEDRRRLVKAGQASRFPGVQVPQLDAQTGEAFPAAPEVG